MLLMRKKAKLSHTFSPEARFGGTKEFACLLAQKDTDHRFILPVHRKNELLQPQYTLHKELQDLE